MTLNIRHALDVQRLHSAAVQRQMVACVPSTHLAPSTHLVHALSSSLPRYPKQTHQNLPPCSLQRAAHAHPRSFAGNRTATPRLNSLPSAPNASHQPSTCTPLHHPETADTARKAPTRPDPRNASRLHANAQSHEHVLPISFATALGACG